MGYGPGFGPGFYGGGSTPAVDQPTLAEAFFTYLSDVMSMSPRIYPWRLPKNVTLPAMTYQILPGPGAVQVHDDAHDAAQPVESLHLRRRVQWDIYAKSYLELEQLEREFRHVMHAFRGDMGGLTIGSVFLDVTIDSYEEDEDVYRRIIDGMVRYNEVIAVGS